MNADIAGIAVYLCGMRPRLMLLIVSVALLGAACASAETSTDSSMVDQTTSSLQEDETQSEDSTAKDSSTTSTTVESEQSTDTEAPAAPKPEGPAAPDFTLALGESGAESFTLSQEVKPVFMVFWAEW